MAFDEGVACIQGLELGEEAGGDVAGTLEGTEEDLDGLLPRLDVDAVGGGEDAVRLAETGVRVDELYDVHALGHDEVVLLELVDGGDFLADEGGGSGDVIVREEVYVVFNGLVTEGEADADCNERGELERTEEKWLHVLPRPQSTVSVASPPRAVVQTSDVQRSRGHFPRYSPPPPSSYRRKDSDRKHARSGAGSEQPSEEEEQPW